VTRAVASAIERPPHAPEGPLDQPTGRHGSPGAWDLARARHLLFRAGFGGPPEEVARLHACGLRKAVDFLVDDRTQPDVVAAMPISEAQNLDPAALRKMSPAERQKLAQQNRQKDQQYIVDLRHWWLKRMVESPRPLEEKTS
jgi:hypothetical protein